MHKAIIFDLGKVLIPFDFKIGYRALARTCPYSSEEIPRRIATTGLVERFEKGLMEPADFVSRLSSELQLQIEFADFCEAWNSIFCGQLIDESVLASLAERYHLLVLSNTNAIHFGMVRERYQALLRHFHDMVLSYEVHSMKPEPEIFHAAIERSGCRPEECFFTDDIALNVEAARREGIDAVQFESPAQLEQEMAARGIAW
jgi:putative hydrolase of the HAD superfamily